MCFVDKAEFEPKTLGTKAETIVLLAESWEMERDRKTDWTDRDLRPKMKSIHFKVLVFHKKSHLMVKKNAN